MSRTSSLRWSLLTAGLCRIFTEANSPDYARFKFGSVRLGIASQAIQSTKLAKGESVQLAVNLAMKIK